MGRPRKTTKQGNGMNAVIYLRVSTEEQAKPGHYGLDAQEELCRKHCMGHGYNVVRVCVDAGISGAKGIDKRPGLAEAILLCEKRNADVIVTYAQDRFARSSKVFEELRERAIHYGYRLETAKDGQVLTSKQNAIPTQVQSFIATLERQMIAERLYNGRRQRSQVDGRGSGPVPQGYIRTLEGVAIDEKMAPAIRALLAMRASKQTYQATADALNAQGFRTSKGSLWTTASVQKTEKYENLYRTGVRQWDDVTSAEKWPPIL